MGVYSATKTCASITWHMTVHTLGRVTTLVLTSLTPDMVTVLPAQQWQCQRAEGN